MHSVFTRLPSLCLFVSFILLFLLSNIPSVPYLGMYECQEAGPQDMPPQHVPTTPLPQRNTFLPFLHPHNQEESLPILKLVHKKTLFLSIFPMLCCMCEIFFPVSPNVWNPSNFSLNWSLFFFYKTVCNFWRAYFFIARVKSVCITFIIISNDPCCVIFGLNL